MIRDIKWRIKKRKTSHTSNSPQMSTNEKKKKKETAHISNPPQISANETVLLKERLTSYSVAWRVTYLVQWRDAPNNLLPRASKSNAVKRCPKYSSTCFDCWVDSWLDDVSRRPNCPKPVHRRGFNLAVLNTNVVFLEDCCFALTDYKWQSNKDKVNGELNVVLTTRQTQ
jgi:hypothetical protein